MFTIVSKYKIATEHIIVNSVTSSYLSCKEWFPMYPDLLSLERNCNRYAHPDTYLPIISDLNTKASKLKELLITNLYLLINSYNLLLKITNRGNQPIINCNPCVNPYENFNCINCLKKRFEHIVNSDSFLINTDANFQFSCFSGV